MRRIYSAMVITVFSNVPRRMIIENVNSRAYKKVSHVRKATKKERAEFLRSERARQDQPIEKRDARRMRLTYREEQKQLKELYKRIRSRYPDSYSIYRCDDDEEFSFRVYDTEGYEMARY